MSSIELLQLPDAVLAKILSFVPKRSEVAKVCWRFYDVIRYLDRNKTIMIVGGYSYDELSLSSIMNSQRICRSMSINLEVKTQMVIEDLKQISQRHGASVRMLECGNHEQFVYSEENFIGMLNNFPNLEELELRTWTGELAKDENMKENFFLNLPKLRKLLLKDCHSNLIEFLSKYLSKNVLTHLAVHNCKTSPEIMKNFTSCQTTIISFNGEGDFEGGDFLDGLELIHLSLQLDRVYIQDLDTLDPATLRPVLRNLIRSQPNLKTLDILQENDFRFKLVDDEIFLEICKIKSLETLKVNISGVAPVCIQNFSNLTNLKSFETATCTVEEAEEAFHELSLVKTVPMEHFEIRLWGEDLPAETFQQFGQNYPTLKYLEIKLGTWHKLNFFMESFPGLETLNICFGVAFNTLSLAQAYKDDGITHLNIKNLDLQLDVDVVVDVKHFIKMLKAFPNLKKLRIFSYMPFTDEFFRELKFNLGNIEELKLSPFFVDANIVFSDETIQNFKHIAKILKYGAFAIFNIEDPQPKPGERETADFLPLVEGLKSSYIIRTNVRTASLYLRVGEPTDQ